MPDPTTRTPRTYTGVDAEHLRGEVRYLAGRLADAERRERDARERRERLQEEHAAAVRALARLTNGSTTTPTEGTR